MTAVSRRRRRPDAATRAEAADLRHACDRSPRRNVPSMLQMSEVECGAISLGMVPRGSDGGCRCRNSASRAASRATAQPRSTSSTRPSSTDSKARVISAPASRSSTGSRCPRSSGCASRTSPCSKARSTASTTSTTPAPAVTASTPPSSRRTTRMRRSPSRSPTPSNPVATSSGSSARWPNACGAAGSV